MDKGSDYWDRRSARRFPVSWEVAVRGMNHTGASFDEAGTLADLSSLGAFLQMTKFVNLGERLELRVRIPFKRNSWITYEAQVVRVEQASTKSGVALKFDTALPGFIER